MSKFLINYVSQTFRHVTLSIHFRAYTLLGCLNHSLPQSSFEVKFIITNTDHAFLRVCSILKDYSQIFLL